MDYVAALSAGEHYRHDAMSSIVTMGLARLAEVFIPACRQYKYAEVDEAREAREQCLAFLTELDSQLGSHSGYLLGDRETVLDINVFPFIRQCRLVDTEWFDALPLPALLSWLQRYLVSEVVQRMMLKVALWEPDHAEVVLS